MDVCNILLDVCQRKMSTIHSTLRSSGPGRPPSRSPADDVNSSHTLHMSGNTAMFINIIITFITMITNEYDLSAF